MVEVKISSWREIWPECRELMFEHWNEVRDRKEHLPFQVDDEGATRLDDLGLMIVVAGREEGRLVGYLVWFLTPALESKGNKIATMGPFYARPESKGVGWKMWQLGMAELRKTGARAAYCHHSSFGPRQEVARRLFEAAGAKPYEVKYEIVLEQEDV